MSAGLTSKSGNQSAWLALAVILLLALGLRLTVARFLANDEPDDGRAYAQLATNLVDHSTFSDDEAAPYQPTLIRVPGYPIFVGVVYLFAGTHNNSAVRLVQAVVDALTCGLIAALAYLWMPDERRKRKAGLIAAAFAALCPFTAIYVATILTETVATFLAVALALTATLALKSSSTRRAVAWWIAGGLIAGISVLIRPDSGLFAAGAGFTLVLVGLLSRCWPGANGAPEPRPFAFRFSRVLLYGAIFSAVFMLVLVPWTIRNKRTFGVFQPLAPAHAEMPGEFVPRGYNRWLRTWVDDEKYIEPAIWALDDEQITVDKLPAKAFDSEEEKNRVAALLDQYNHPPPSPDDNNPAAPTGPQTLPLPGEAAPTPGSSKFVPPPSPGQSNTNSAPRTRKVPTSNPANTGANDNSAGDANDNANDEGDSADDEKDDAADDNSEEEKPAVEMTPAIDAGFARIAQERISRSPVRYYVWMPVKRMFALWFGTHSQYYPFAGQLLPWSELDHTTHQQIWLPLFALVVALYTILGKIGGWLLIFKRGGRKWAVLVALLCIPRIVFFATLENPEPRYVVELFAFTSILAGMAVAYFWPSRTMKEEPGENREQGSRFGAFV
jgi:hypothetical protein